MDTIFSLIWLLTLIAIPYLGIKLYKLKQEEKNKKGFNGIKQKIKSVFKKEEQEVKKSKFTIEQVKTFFIGSIILFFVSFVGIGMTAPTVENNEIDNNNILGSYQNSITNTIKNETTLYENIIQNETNTETTNEVNNGSETDNVQSQTPQKSSVSLSEIPKYNEKAYVSINNNIPFFSESDMATTSYEKYSALDANGRCGVAIACVGKDIMPTEERENIGSIKPTGWHTVKYKGIDGNYLYNRCHLIGFQLTGENANDKNLITGTRYLNVEGMLPFENLVADYVKETNNHVLFRVTPMFEGDNLLVSGVLMEAKSVEDNGKGVQFNVYCYNVQPGIEINYKTGESSGPEYTGTTTSNNTQSSSATDTNNKTDENNKNNATTTSTTVSNTTSNSTTNTSSSSSTSSSITSTSSSSTTSSSTTSTSSSSSTSSSTASTSSSSNTSSSTTTSSETEKTTSNTEGNKPADTSSSEVTTTNPATYTYILNTNSKKFHEPSCGSAKQIKEKNKDTFTGTRDQIIAKGYSPCGNCDP